MKIFLFVFFFTFFCVNNIILPIEAKQPLIYENNNNNTEESDDTAKFNCQVTSDCLKIDWKCKRSIGKCVDCHEVIGGNAIVDDCGECTGGDTGRAINDMADCNGECFGPGKEDDCGICDGNNESKDDCGVCDGGNRDKDLCGVCFGDSSSCKDCNGIPNGGLVYDACGICGGDSTVCCGDTQGSLCNGEGYCDPDIQQCVCNIGWTGKSCEVRQTRCYDSLGKEIIDCGEHGYCSEYGKGQCICDPGFYGPKCKYETCNGNGIWSPKYEKCICAPGFGGDKCDRCAVPGESKGIREIAYRLSRMDPSSIITLSYGNDDNNNFMDQKRKKAITTEQKSDNKNNNYDERYSSSGRRKKKPLIPSSSIMIGETEIQMLVPKEERERKEKVYVCVPPRIYNQEFYDNVKIMSGKSVDSITNIGDTEERMLVNYELWAIKKSDLYVFLKKTHVLSTGLVGFPILPNNTQNNVFYDCGCRAWAKETLEDSYRMEIYEEKRYLYERDGIRGRDWALEPERNEYGGLKWTGSPAGHTIRAWSNQYRHGGMVLRNNLYTRAINESECETILDHVLEEFGSELTSTTGNAEQISEAIDDGFDRISFIQDFLVGLVVGEVVAHVLSLAAIMLGVFVYVLYRLIR